MFLVTTLPEPMVTLSPMVTPGKIIEFPPIQTLSPIVTGFVEVKYRVPVSFFMIRSDAFDG